MARQERRSVESLNMTSKAYLTIDDSPSTRTDDLVSFLKEKKVPALFFCCGNLLEQNLVMAVRIIQGGFHLANHAFSHARASDLSLEEMIAEIERTENLIDQAYDLAYEERPPRRHFRFPHMDRGCAGWIVDYEGFKGDDLKDAKTCLTEGLNVISMKRPDSESESKKLQLQKYLKDESFTVPFPGVTHSWYNNPEIKKAHDCLFTFSTCDWMVTQRHLGNWRYKSPEDLKLKIDLDRWLNEEDSVNIVLTHDQAEIIDVTIDLIDHMLKKGIQFLEV